MPRFQLIVVVDVFSLVHSEPSYDGKLHSSAQAESRNVSALSIYPADTLLLYRII